ncbi:toprim domain-containing protein [Actinomadura opuntiae]|uniref:toprim domain-containing protein n=1 Tax=Actinomadura sp. OS1-43 TaxID=604315 RepID=UPI00255A96B3|nr:toprim domain-containing protein [Actinomadura sp. OS1-43]MDL4813193.1 toprim domain-containing protein [Actinomadura sp. OS1-43]
MSGPLSAGRERPGAEEERHLQADFLQGVAEYGVAGLLEGRLSWTEWLKHASRHGRYGFTNTLLIPAQRRTATDIRSYDDWKKEGRQVLRGETGIRILSRSGKPRPVFDIEQTDGVALEEPEPVSTSDGLARLARMTADLGLYLDRGQGWTYLGDPARRLPVAPEMDDLAAATRLAHQLAHVLDARGRLDASNLDQDECHGARRAFADSVAFLVLAEAGLPTEHLSFSAPRSWAGTDERANATRTVRLVGEQVVRTASRLRYRLSKLPPPDSAPALKQNVLAQVEQKRSTRSPASRETPDAETEAPSSAREELLAALEEAHRFFIANLAGSWGASYLAGRGFSPEIQARWQVGHAVRSRQALVQHLRKRGHSDEVIVAAGLAKPGRDGELTDVFRDRVLLPFRNSDGAIVGFVGRQQDGFAGPKYLNTPDTVLFHKREVLFGLWETSDRLGQGVRPLLVEGPLDAIAVNTVMPGTYAALATCGTAISRAHLDALGHHTDLSASGLVLALDGDPAGRVGAIRAWRHLSTIGGPVETARLPTDRDPANLLDKPGHVDVQAALRSVIPLADLVIDERLERFGGTLEFAENRLAAVRAAAAVIAGLPPDQAARQVARVASRTQWDPAEVTAAVASAITSDPATDLAPAATDFPSLPDLEPHPPRRETRAAARPTRPRRTK